LQNKSFAPEAISVSRHDWQSDAHRQNDPASFERQES